MRIESVSLIANQASANPQGGMSSLFVLLFFFLAFWFFLIAPQRKKQKEQEKMIAALKNGDHVMTTSGIFGTVTNVKADRLIIKTADVTKIEIHRNFVQAKFEKPKEEKQSEVENEK